ncbi:hypothetical protein EG68_06888 [Paragonimus skrjabini miyazakii]|uniref:LIM zinc-binding domain-containing protein n=1 Tax=Paragonimus skrjabini miyazakii TaxID=59628 RepID=A0A8S9YRS9_9TREM|nr:hypothetical protein EG68_06888 [Paragonimus skrjabini miyazakii]
MKRCWRCKGNLVIGDTVLTTYGCYFHLDCLRCACCDQNIQTRQFRPVSGLLPVCRTCWLTKSYSAIESLIKRHENNDRVDQTHLSETHNKLWNFGNPLNSSSVLPVSDVMCHTCGGAIRMGCEYVHVNEKPHHASCLVCAACHIVLADKPFAMDKKLFFCLKHIGHLQQIT